jgi:hypothetical protein
MNDDYDLTPEQRRWWAEKLPKRRGLQTQIAQALRAKKQGEEASWRTQISLFFKGDAKGLAAVFSHEARVEIVAETIRVAAADLRAWLDAAKGTARADAIDMLRLPGFEDYGPLPALTAFWPPVQDQTAFHLVYRKRVHTSAGGAVKVDDLVEVLSDARAGVPRAIVIAADHGMGRTPLLRYLAARLMDGERPVSPWVPGGVPDAGVVMWDDLDALSPDRRQALIAEVHRTCATLLTSTNRADSLADLPQDRVVVTLRPGYVSWALEYLGHLEKLLPAILHRPVDLSPLAEWLEDDPAAAALAGRADTIGFLARNIADGHKVPVRLCDIAELAVKRKASALRQDGRGPEALVTELCGVAFLGRLAEDMCRSGSTRVPLATAAKLLVAAAGKGLAGRQDETWGELGAPGMLAVLEAMMTVGLLHRAGDDVLVSPEVYLVSALGRVLRRHADDAALVGAIVMEPRWCGSLVAAAELDGDIVPMLTAIGRLSAGVRVQAQEALTLLLSSGVAASSATVLQEAFIDAAWWWTVNRANPRSMTIDIAIGGSPGPAAAAPRGGLVSGIAPLVALGLASAHHVRRLPSSITPQMIRGARAAREFGALLRALGVPDATDESLHDTLFLGCPFQSDAILHAENWARLPPLEHDLNRTPGGINQEDCALWWRAVAVPRLRRERDGVARLVGCAGGMRLRSAMMHTGRGVEMWSAMLVERFTAGDAEAPAAFADGVRFTIDWGGLANLRGLVSVWDAVRPTRMGPAASVAVAAALPPWGPSLPEVATWVITQVLSKDQQMALWTAWTEASPDAHPHLPWRAFLEGGVPEATVLNWALDSLPDEPVMEAGQRWVPDANPGVLQLRHHGRSVQIDILEHLAVHGERETLLLLADGDYQFAKAARPALQRRFPRDARRLRVLMWAASRLPNRSASLAAFRPEADDGDLWESVAHQAQNLPERLVRLVQHAVVVGDESWPMVLDLLRLAEIAATPVGDREQALAEMAAVDGTNVEQVDSRVADMLDALEPALPPLLAEVGGVLLDAHRRLGRDVRVIVEHLAQSHRLMAMLSGGGHAAWWGLLAAAMTPAWVARVISDGFSATGDVDGTYARLDGCAAAGLVADVVEPLVGEGPLGELATIVFARRSPRTEDLVLALERLLAGRSMSDGDGRPVACQAHLTARLIGEAPEPALDRLRLLLQPLPVDHQEAWWRLVLGLFPEGVLRAAAVDAWIATQLGSSQ